MSFGQGLTAVKFGAKWCAPCKVLSGTLKKLQGEFAEIKFEDVDIDDKPTMARDYKIRSVPTLILFYDGQEITRILGAAKIDALRKALRDIVKEKAA